jgi:hypothetical protein
VLIGKLDVIDLLLVALLSVRLYLNRVFPNSPPFDGVSPDL